MNEALLHFLWKFKKFKTTVFTSTCGKNIQILNFGTQNTIDGPDFLYGKIKVDEVILVGNIEMHVKSSDWEKHKHQGNTNYDQLILHVVYSHDKSIDYLEEKSVYTIELKDLIDEKLIETSQIWMTNSTDFIPCEKTFHRSHLPFQMQEQIVLKKLDAKAIEIEEWMQASKNDLEFVFYQKLAYTFGLKHNSEVFLTLFRSLDAKVLQKLKQNSTQLHALFYGLCNALDIDITDEAKIWKSEYRFLKNKFQLPTFKNRLNFAKQLPPNFPTIRLSQLANLLHQQPHLFSKIIEANSITEIKSLFTEITAHEYWDNKFQFQKISTDSYPKKLSNEMIDRLMINAVLPMRYYYFKEKNEDEIEKILEFYKQIKPDRNTKTKEAQKMGFPMNNALDSQFFLYLYSHYCSAKQCLNCGIGYQILKNDK